MSPDASPSAQPKVETLKALLQCQPKAVVSRMLVKNHGGSVTLFAFDQGEGLSEHTAPYEALLIGVEGQAKVQIDGVEHLLGEGQSVLIPARAPHALEPLTPFKMLLVMIKSERKPAQT